MQNKDEILRHTLKKVSKMKNDLVEEINKYEIEKFQLNSEETKLSSEELDKISETVKPVSNRLTTFIDEKENVGVVKNDFVKQKSVFLRIINSESNNISFDEIMEIIANTKGYRANETNKIISDFCKVVGVKYPFSINEFEDLNGKIMIVRAFQVNYDENHGSYMSKSEILKNIKGVLIELDKKFDKYISFMNELNKALDRKIDEHSIKIKTMIDEAAKNKIAEKKNKLSELDLKIDECNKRIEEIEEIYNIYDQYLESKNQDTAIKLSGELSKLGIMTKRELKILRHKEKEKVDEPKEEVKEEPKEEKQVIKEEKKLDNLMYFTKEDANEIICFLGTDNDWIMDDVSNHFDNSRRPNVLRELNDIFNGLYVGDNPINTGGNPGPFTGRTVLTLLEPPFKFNYKRFGVSRDQFRIHAIERHSDLLKKLGYGSGNVIFFGAVGINDSKEKSYAYDRLGSRAIRQLSSNGSVPKLRSNFDFIEHITRGYVPTDLLSANDLIRLSNGDFYRQIKGGIDISIENSKYFLYDELDNDTKKNVNDYLYEYFTKQSQKMFDIINEYKSLKDNSLD